MKREHLIVLDFHTLEGFHVNPKRLIKLNDEAFQRRQFSSSNKSGS